MSVWRLPWQQQPRSHFLPRSYIDNNPLTQVCYEQNLKVPSRRCSRCWGSGRPKWIRMCNLTGFSIQIKWHFQLRICWRTNMAPCQGVDRHTTALARALKLHTEIVRASGINMLPEVFFFRWYHLIWFYYRLKNDSHYATSYVFQYRNKLTWIGRSYPPVVDCPCW